MPRLKEKQKKEKKEKSVLFGFLHWQLVLDVDSYDTSLRLRHRITGLQDGSCAEAHYVLPSVPSSPTSSLLSLAVNHYQR